MLAACDGTDLSQAVVVAALQLCEPGSALIVVHVDELLVGGGAAGLPVEIDEPERRAYTTRLVDQLRRDGVAAGLRLVPAVSRGTADALAECARAEHADVIVVATRARGLLSELAFGHVADRLIAASPCPVLVVPPR